MSEQAPALEVRNLTVTVRLRDGGEATVLDDVSFSVERGGTLGIVGESGSGKTMTSLAITGLLPRAARIRAGEVLLHGRDLRTMSQREVQRLRGSEIAMVLQDPMTALDPSFTIRSQLAQPLRRHRGLQGRRLEEATVAALEQVHLSAAKNRLNQYPHQLSGGMRQRVTSAIALAGEPSVLIADEPTTALDVTTQSRYLQLLNELQRTEGFALILIAHDLLIVRHVCASVVVMYAGQVVESGPTASVFTDPQHPYTRALVRAIPVLDDTVRLESIEGQAPDVTDVIDGCRFASRCASARAECTDRRPPLTERPDGRLARCWGTDAGGWIDWQ
jgi:oligopeptide/dipeptide ABC transporter ATP-binding protein